MPYTEIELAMKLAEEFTAQGVNWTEMTVRKRSHRLAAVLIDQGAEYNDVAIMAACAGFIAAVGE